MNEDRAAALDAWQQDKAQPEGSEERERSDVVVRDEGSLILLIPQNDWVRQWFEDHVGQDNGYQGLWPTVVVEPRYVDAILHGLLDEGFVLERF